jgi:hypothetical protein
VDTPKKNESNETITSYCSCAGQTTTWVRGYKWVPCKSDRGGYDAREYREGWKCLNCGKFRALG